MDFCLLPKIWVKILSNKYGQKVIDTAKKSITYAIKTASKRAIQKTAEATGDLIVNKIADKITSISKKSNKELLIIMKKKIWKSLLIKKVKITERKTANYR